MIEMIFYGIGYFLATILIQFLFSKFSKKGKLIIWEGPCAVIVICVLGIIESNVNYLAAVLGFVIADAFGKKTSLSVKNI